MMDLAVVMPWVIAAMTILNFGGLIQNMLSRGEKALGEKVKGHEKTLTDHDRRIQAVEGELKHLPNKDTVNKLQVDMTELKGDIALIAKSSEATERATRRVEEFLLKHTN